MLKLRELQNQLKEYVYGQDDAINAISCAIFKTTLKAYGVHINVKFDTATSLLLIGESGSGKTYLVKKAAELVELPFYEIDCKNLGLGGSWTGTSITTHLTEMLGRNSKENGCPCIIFLDEFDKVLIPSYSSGGDDVNYQIQTTLLKVIENQELSKHVDTKNCLFVLGGAFVDLELENPPQIGFNTISTNKNTLNQALIKYGLIPELCGRIQEKILMNKISEDTYKQIINSKNFILENWAIILEKLGIHVKVNNKKLIAEAIKSQLGVRGLIEAVEKEITLLMYKNLDKIDLNNLYIPNSFGRL